MDVEECENTLEYWKEKYESLNEEFNEFQTDSQILEEELEKELKETKQELANLNQKYSMFQFDANNHKDRLEQDLASKHEKIEKLEQLNLELSKKDEYQVQAIRQLEQNLDDLERNNRNTLATISTLENQLADEIERNALLEADMDRQTELEAECQRLRDQARDINHELLRVKKKRDSKLDHPMARSRNESLNTSQKSNSPSIGFWVV